jgi:hypothetical protein
LYEVKSWKGLVVATVLCGVVWRKKLRVFKAVDAVAAGQLASPLQENC